jgi:hypothetical protein
VEPEFGALMNNLIMTTDQFIMGSLPVSTPSAWSSSQGIQPRIAPGPLAWSVALRASRDISIQASIEYVGCLPILISLIRLVPRIGRIREYIDLTDKPNIDKLILGYWRNLWSSLDFIDQFLKSCVNIIHLDIVEIWNLRDKSRVSSPQLLCYFTCSTALVSVEQPIQDKNVAPRQRSSCASWRRIAEVSVF